MTTLRNGEPIPAPGWYVDGHGHRLYLQPGSLAPLCPRFGLVPVRWQLVGPPLPGPDVPSRGD